MRKRKRILRYTFDTRPLEHKDALGMTMPGYTGYDLAKCINTVSAEARNGGYDSWEFKWWDWCDGWAYARGEA